MVFFLVMVNTTIAAQLNYLFMSIYILEIFVSFLLLAAVPLAVYTLMGMTKFHLNIRLSASSVIIHLALAILARFVLLYYQINQMPMGVTDFVFLAANLVRESVAGWSIAVPIAISAERSFATIFSSWYEKQSLGTLVVFIVQSLVLEIYGWTNALLLIYGVYSIQFNVIEYGVVFFGGAVLFQYVLMMNVEYGKRLQKMSITAYCLSRAYQIRENIKIMKMLRKLAFPALIFNIPAFSFISLHIFLPYEERLSLVRNVSIALFDLWIALYAASFQLLAYNIEPHLQESLRRSSYAAYCLDRYDRMPGRIRKLTQMSSPPHLNKTDIYFTMLSKDLHSAKKLSTISKISII
ncbi:hypothetical protein PRIPAC_78659 [Pristionchus pacificus]|uniref:G protein-coupled receptor n=1 Tax=Pristionchus pacificus TaxID=54126 RepID=A0A2A6C300_PRIPA|nr:hypothetical protein PRIPAC_78659 [Pristionchus pacificus]|eukprot:PDM72510.1 G protein-coupled receptor [Pristionchus pacificus]